VAKLSFSVYEVSCFQLIFSFSLLTNSLLLWHFVFHSIFRNLFFIYLVILIASVSSSLLFFHTFCPEYLLHFNSLLYFSVFLLRVITSFVSFSVFHSLHSLVLW